MPSLHVVTVILQPVWNTQRRSTVPRRNDGCTASLCRRRAGTARNTTPDRTRGRRSGDHTQRPEAPPAPTTCRDNTSTSTVSTPVHTIPQVQVPLPFNQVPERKLEFIKFWIMKRLSKPKRQIAYAIKCIKTHAHCILSISQLSKDRNEYLSYR